MMWAEPGRQKPVALASLRGREPRESLAGDAEDGPVVQRCGAQRFVELDGRRIPIQRCPLEAGAAPLMRDARHVQQQSAPVPLAAKLRLYVDIFEPQTARSEERGKVVEEHRESHRR